MIYLLEDDAGIRELVCYSLEKTGMKSVGFSTPGMFWDAMARETPSLIFLDCMLPEEDGISILKRIRADRNYSDIPVIMLTAKDSEFDKVVALDAGADDYITKPFGVMEMIARANAVLRRTETVTKKNDGIYSCREFELDTAKRVVKVNSEEITLTYKEFELLKFLVENRGNVVSRDRILSEIWGYDFDGENRTVDVHVRTIRQKLGSASDIIETVRGVGYKVNMSF